VAERDSRLVNLSKLLSLVLRHDPSVLGLELDPAGWVPVDALLAALAKHGRPVERSHLERLVRENDKQRFAFSADGAFLRANQGHTVSVALGYAPEPPPATLYHGTVGRFLRSIRAQGLRKGKRQHVHLSVTPMLAESVGKRRGRPIVLEIDAGLMASAGYEFLRAPNGVWLTDHVPARFVRVPAPDPAPPSPRLRRRTR
jgi:putative RNA 2'-phosphotransferase